jgi:quercetin dioxygenase-like cupin family protein
MSQIPAPWVEMFPGIRRRRCALTDEMYQMEVWLEEGAEVPLHHHTQTQISFVISGKIRFQRGGDIFECLPGSAVSIPGNTPHAIWAVERSYVVDTFSPVRADYLARDQEG